MPYVCLSVRLSLSPSICISVCVQCQFDCCLSPMLMSPMELSWMVGMFSGFIPGAWWHRSPVSHLSTVSLLWPTNCSVVCAELTLWHPLLAYGYSYIKHPVPDRVKPYSFVIFDIQALWRSALSVRVPGCQKLPMSMGQPGLGVKLLSRWRFIDIARLV